MPKGKGNRATKVASGDKNAKGVMVYTDLDGNGAVLYYIDSDELKKYKMDEGTPGYGEGTALVDRNVILSAVATTDVPVGAYSTLVNVAALNYKKLT